MAVTDGPFYTSNWFIDDFKDKSQTVRMTTTH